MENNRLTMNDVHQHMAAAEAAMELANQRFELEETLRDLRKEHAKLSSHHQLLASASAQYIANSLQDIDIMKMLHREFFPSVMPVSALFHVDGPVYSALLIASGLGELPDPPENAPEMHMRTIQEPLGLPESMAAALVAVHLGHAVINFHNKGRPINNRLPALTPEQCASLAMSGFNSPLAWMDRLYEFQDFLKVHISGNDYHDGARDRYLSAVMSAANRQFTPQRLLSQVESKVERVIEQIRATEEAINALGQGAPIPMSEFVPVSAESLPADAGRMLPSQLTSILTLQQSRREAERLQKEAQGALSGARSYLNFLERPGASYVLSSLVDPALMKRLYGEISPVVYPDGVDYAMQSAAQGVLSGVVIEMLMEGARAHEPSLDPWAPTRLGGDGEAGLIHRIASAAMATRCGEWLDMLGSSQMSEAQYASLALSGFHQPTLWEEIYAAMHGLLEFGNRPPAHMAPSHIADEANRGWTPAAVLGQARQDVVSAERALEELSEQVAALSEKISQSPHRDLVAREVEKRAPGTPLDTGLQSNRAGRGMIFRLLSLLSKSKSE